MTSSDNFVTVDLFNAGIREIKSEIREVRYENQLNGAKMDWMQTSIYWGFAIIAFVVTFVAIFVPSFKRGKSEKNEEALTTEKVQSMIDDAISRALLTS